MTAVFWHDIAIGGGATLLLAAILAGIGGALVHLGAGSLLARKIPHALCGVSVAVAVFWLSSLAAAVAVLIVTAVTLVFVVERGLVRRFLDGTRASDYGLVGFALGVLVAVAAFWSDRVTIAGGVLVLGLADSGAALVGRAVGRHRVAVGGAVRTLEGSAAFVAIAFTISLAVNVIGFRTSVPVALAVSVFVGLTTASIELLVPPAVDNLLITPWVALLLHIGHNLQSTEALRWLTAAVMAYGAVPLMVRSRWLNLPGAVGAALVAAAAIGLGGWVWIAPMTVFLVLTGVMTAYRRVPPAGSRWGLTQVVVNGVLPVMVPAIGYALTGNQVWFAVYIGGVVVALAVYGLSSL